MPTRRQTIVGLASALASSGALVSGAFDGVTTSHSADLRIIADPPARGVKLLPGREDEAYVLTDEEGRVTEIVLKDSGDRGLSQGAQTRFEQIVEIHKTPPGPPIEELYFTFEVTDEGLEPGDPTPETIESALSIVSASGDVPGEGETDYFEATEEAAPNDKLTPNDSVPFGIGVDLLSEIRDLPDSDRYSVKLVIESA